MKLPVDLSISFQERDKILHEVSEREERLQKERDAKDKLQKQIQVADLIARRLSFSCKMFQLVDCWSLLNWFSTFI